MPTINKVVRFDYSGGSTPGATRLVFVTNESAWNFHGWDFDRQEFRNFSVNKAANMATVSAQVVPLATLPDKVNVRELIDDYEDDGYLAYEGDDYLVVVRDNRVVTPLVASESLVLQFSNSTGSVSIAVDDNTPAKLRYFDSGGNLTREETRNLGSAGMVLAKALS